MTKERNLQKREERFSFSSDVSDLITCSNVLEGVLKCFCLNVGLKLLHAGGSVDLFIIYCAAKIMLPFNTEKLVKSLAYTESESSYMSTLHRVKNNGVYTLHCAIYILQGAI